MADYLGQILLIVLGLVIELGAPLFLSEDSQKRFVRWLGAIFIIGAALWFGYGLGQKQGWGVVVLPLPKNVSQRFDFEQRYDNSVSLGVCDDSVSPWYEHCREAPDRLSWADGGFTGEHSIGVRVEVVPEKQQAYSIRFPLDPPVFADAVSANVYIPDATQISKIILAAHLKGETNWAIGEINSKGDGWMYLFIDLRQFPAKSGQPASEIGIDEIHIDLFASKAMQDSEEVLVRIDDIELYFPHVNSYISE